MKALIDPRIRRLAIWMPMLANFGRIQAGDDVWTGVGPDGGLVYSLPVDPQNPVTLFALSRFAMPGRTAPWP